MKRTLIENVPILENLKHLVEYHIQHQYAKQSEKKSNIIPLGILEKDENIMEQMIEIMEHLQQYVPTTENGKMIPLLLGGDALSVERGDGAQRARQDARTPEQRLDGYLWKSEDWHGHIISLQESFNMLFKGSSSGERGTLFQLKNMLDRRGVKSEVTKPVNDCREFMRLTTQGFILLAALQVLGVDNLIEFDNHVNNLATDEQNAELMEHIVQTIVDRFIKTERFTLDCDETTEDNNQTNRVPCSYPGCPKSYLLDGLCRRNHRQTCQYKDLDILQPHEPVANEPKTKTKKKSTDYKSDYKFNYTCCVLRDGLMDWCREDSAKENDGDRLFRMWKFDMLRFSNSNHTKYRLLAFKLQAQIMATIPQRLAFELKHNQSINIHGEKGGNVPGDLALEFFNMRAKDALHALHGNLTSTSIKRVGRSLQGCNDIMDAYVNGLGHYFGKPSNSKPSFKKT
ncbi:uncharacterized protein [Mytilus edulis]|uniref:uncharacterized protein n=1 Tax=Mytilus edulis TaxID=6550 RepID=UPI0039EF61EF